MHTLVSTSLLLLFHVIIIDLYNCRQFSVLNVFINNKSLWSGEKGERVLMCRKMAKIKIDAQLLNV